MKTNQLRPISLSLFFSATLLSVSGCANLNDPYAPGGYGGGYGNYGGGYGGYNQPPPYYGGPGYYNNNYQDYRQEQRELERERRRLEDERRRLERERQQQYNRPPPPPPPAPRPVDRCPAGFSPSENKCSPQERRQGCRDIRLPSGLGCVSR